MAIPHLILIIMLTAACFAITRSVCSTAADQAGSRSLCNDLVFNPQTLGIKIERQEQIDSFMNNSTAIPPYSPKNIRNYAEAFANLMIETMSRKYPGLKNELGRTIYISYGDTDPRIKKMKAETKRMLYDNGVAGAHQFLTTHPLP